MLSYIKKFWNSIVSSYEEPLALTKAMEVTSNKKKKRMTFKKVKRLRVK